MRGGRAEGGAKPIKGGKSDVSGVHQNEMSGEDRAASSDTSGQDQKRGKGKKPFTIWTNGKKRHLFSDSR